MQRELLSAAARSVWGKSDRDTGDWMPLYRHMADAAAVAELIWDKWLPYSVRRLVGENLTADGARTLAVWLAAVHDLGKASPAFSVQVEGLADRMSRCGLPVPASIPPVERRCAPHSIASHVLLRRWLVEELQFDPRVADTYAIVPGGHHGVTPSSNSIHVADRGHLLGTGRWLDVHRELAEFAAAISRAREYLSGWRTRPLSPLAQVLLTAVVIVADWIASDAERFPYLDHRSAGARAAQAWDDIGLTAPWQPLEATFTAPVEELFRSRFDLPTDAVVRPVQLAAVELAARVRDPGLLIVEAPMGEGKTELALAAAEVLAGRFGAGGCFVALPTMATSDAMFVRVVRWMEHLTGTGANSTFLAHGKSALNADYHNLLYRGHPVGIGQDNLSDERTADGAESVAVALQWLSGRKKGVLASFVVGTIDQILVGALKSRHLVLRHLSVAGKIVVIDEAHAADEYMSVYLDQILLWLGAYRVPTIVLSATLPSARRRAMVAAYDQGRHSDTPVQVPSAPFQFRTRLANNPAPSLDPSDDLLAALDGDIGYPVITASTGGRPEIVVAQSSGRSLTVAVERAADDDDTLIGLLAEALQDGGCVGVVRNTVRRAQETARLLRTHYGADVFLLHSRFLAVDRIAREAELRAWLGPEGGLVRRPGRKVIVGTQVLEQSLDIDFDLLVTDLAPMDLLLQRLGRLHRHARPPRARPESLRRPRCVLVGVEHWHTEPPTPIRASKYVYSYALLLRTFAVLNEIWEHGDTLHLPGQIAPLVQHAYSPNLTAPLSWGDTLRVAQLEHDTKVSRRRRAAEHFLLGPVGAAGSTIFDWNGKGVGDAEDDVQGQAQVRDGDEAVEVVVVQQIGSDFFIPEWVRPFGGRQLAHNGEPDRSVAKAAAACTLRLPGWMSTPGYISRLIDALEANGKASWQQSPWLKGQLILVLDENLRTELLGANLTYDRDDGLVVTTPGKSTP